MSENLRCVDMNNIEKIVAELKEGPQSFTDLKRNTGVQNGVIQYHLRTSEILEKEKKGVMISGHCNKCGLKNLCQERCIETVLNDESKKLILDSFDKGLSQREIASNMDISAATVNYHLNQMRKFNIIKNQKVRSEIREKL